MEIAELRLKERTALLVGPLSRVHQSLAYRLTQLGADVVFAAPEVDQAQRFASQILETREIKERYGRAAAIPYQTSSVALAQDMVSRAAEFFGGVDILVESTPLSPLTPFLTSTLDDLEKTVNQNLASALYTTRAALPFFQGRKRGRIVYLLHDLISHGLPGSSLQSAARSGLMSFAQTLAREVAEFNVTVNCVSQGLTEEFLLSMQPQSPSLQTSLNELRAKYPSMNLTDPERIADTVTYLVSSLGLGVSGQTLRVRNGMGGLE